MPQEIEQRNGVAERVKQNVRLLVYQSICVSIVTFRHKL